MTRRIFISGPMSGHPDFNRAAFNAEAARLRALGYEIINPAELVNDGVDYAALEPLARRKHWQQCMRVCIAKLATCDVLALLQGWEQSEGASAEHYVANVLGLEITMADDIGGEA